MSKFKDRLWRDLVREHGAQLARIDRPAARHSRRARPRVLAGTTLGLAGIGAAMALVLGAASSTPAFAVTRNHDGTVTVALQRIAAIHDANAKLAGSGLRVKLVQVQAGCLAAARAKALAALSKARPQYIPPPHWKGRTRFNPRKIPPGKTLVIAAWGAGQSAHVSPGHLVTGSAPACVPPPVPPLPACAITKLSTPGNGSNTGTSSGTGTSTNRGTSSSTGTSSGTSPAPLPQAAVQACKGNGARVTALPRRLRGLPCVAAMIHALPGGPAPIGTSANTGSGTSTDGGTSTNGGTSTVPLPRVRVPACKGIVARAAPAPQRLLGVPCVAVRIHALPANPTVGGATGTSSGTVPLPLAAVRAFKARIARARPMRPFLMRRPCVAARIHALPAPPGNAATTANGASSGKTGNSGHTQNSGKTGKSANSGNG